MTHNRQARKTELSDQSLNCKIEDQARDWERRGGGGRQTGDTIKGAAGEGTEGGGRPG